MNYPLVHDLANQRCAPRQLPRTAALGSGLYADYLSGSPPVKSTVAVVIGAVLLVGCAVIHNPAAVPTVTATSSRTPQRPDPQVLAAERKADAARKALCELVRAVETPSVRAARQRARAGRTHLVFIGDSYTQGVSLPDPLSTYPYVLHRTLGAGVVVDGEGSTGILSDGPCGGGRFDRRMAALRPYQPSPLVIQSGLNDVGLGDVAAHAESLIRSWGGPVIVIGPPYAGSWPRTGIDAVAEQLRAAASATGAQYIDLRLLQLPPAPDHIHTTEYGQLMIASAVERALENR